MNFLFGVVVFVVALLVSVCLHEAGHLLTAKRFGMKASQYFAGFGPTLWSRRWGETEYGIKAIPLGGFVKIVGYTPLEPIEEADRPRAFYRRPAKQRVTVIIAGVVVNFVLALVLMMVLAMGVGINGDPTRVVKRVSACAPTSRQALQTGTCAEGAPKSPAAQAGLRPGDEIVGFGGEPVRDWQGLTSAIKAHKPGETVAVTVRRDGERVTLHPTLAAVPGTDKGFFGVAPTIGVDRLGPVEAGRFTVNATGRLLSAIGHVVVDIPSAIPTLFSDERASTPGGQAGSIVGGARVTGQEFSSTDSWHDKTVFFLTLVISLNMFVALLNVIPILPMDGGHFAVVLYERIKARVYRVRGRPDPGPVDMTKLMPVTYVAVVLLVGFGVLLILADIVNPLKIPQ